MSFPVYGVSVEPSSFFFHRGQFDVAFAGGIKWQRGCWLRPPRLAEPPLPVLAGSSSRFCVQDLNRRERSRKAAEDAEYGGAPLWQWGAVTGLL